jgi:hypothetical protein
MALPAGPTAPCIVLQAHRSRGRLTAAREGPAAPGSPDDRRQGRGLPGQDPVGGQVRSAHTPPDPQPAAPPGLLRWAQRRPAPVLPAWPRRPLAGPPPSPARRRQRGQARLDRRRPPVHPDRCWARHGQDSGRRPARQPPAPAAMLPIDAVAGHPCRRPASRAGARPQRAGQLWRGGTAPGPRHARLLATRPRVRPLLGPIPLAIPPRLAQRTGSAHNHTDWAVLPWAHGPRVLAGAPGRVAPLVHHAGCVADQDPVGSPHRLEESGPHRLAHQVRLPVGAGQHGLDALRRRRAAGCRHWPTGRARRLPAPAAPRAHDPVAGLRAGDRRGQPPREVRHVGPAAFKPAGRRIGRRREQSLSRFSALWQGSVLHPCVRNHDTSVTLLLPL